MDIECLIDEASLVTTFGVDKFTATDGQVKFTLSAQFKANSCIVFRNGVLQESTVDYNETDTRSSITFTAGLEAGEKVEARYAVE